MKKVFSFAIVVALLAVLASSSFGAFSYTLTSKSKLFQDYLVAGTYTNATAEANSIVTGLDYIKAYGLVVTSETATGLSGVKGVISSGSINVTSNQGSTLEANQPDGTWFAIGR